MFSAGILRCGWQPGQGALPAFLLSGGTSFASPAMDVITPLWDPEPQIPLPARSDSSKTPGVQSNCLKSTVVLACVLGLMTSLAAGQPRPPAPGKGATALSTSATKKTSSRPALTGKPIPSIPSGATLLQESSRPSKAAAAGARAVKVAAAPNTVRVAPLSFPPQAVKAKKEKPAPPVAQKVKPALQPAPRVVEGKPLPASTALAQPKPSGKKVATPANAKKSAAAMAAPAPAAPQTKAEKLAELTELYRNDKISPKEFHARRERLLSE